jgi:hypothetical protein
MVIAAQWNHLWRAVKFDFWTHCQVLPSLSSVLPQNWSSMIYLSRNLTTNLVCVFVSTVLHTQIVRPFGKMYYTSAGSITKVGAVFTQVEAIYYTSWGYILHKCRIYILHKLRLYITQVEVIYHTSLGYILHKFRLLHKLRLYITQIEAICYTSRGYILHKFRLCYTNSGYILHNLRLYVTQVEAIYYTSLGYILCTIRLYSYSEPG